MTKWNLNRVCLIGVAVFLLVIGAACGGGEDTDSSSSQEAVETSGDEKVEPEGDLVGDVPEIEGEEIEESVPDEDEGQLFPIEPAKLPSAEKRRVAPDFTLSDLSGNQVSLSDYRGKIVILDFWATWCPPCRMEIPHFIDLQNKYQSKGVEIVGIAMDREGIKAVLPFVQKQNVNYISLIGTGQVTSDYGGVRSIPTTFVIDQKGRIVTQHVGFTERRIFESEIVALLLEG